MPANENPTQIPIERVCPKCGTILKRDWKACPDCGWTMTSRGISHDSAIASIACCVIGFFFLGLFFGLMGIGLGASAVIRKDKDKLGFIGIILGIIIIILSIFSIIDPFLTIYY